MKKPLTFLFILIVCPAAAFGISEADFQQEYHALVEPFFDTFKEGSFSGAGGIRISYAARVLDNETGALVILHGKSESYIKYAELAYDLRKLGLSLYLMDHRGMGFSERIVSDDPQRVHVDRFGDYVADVKQFVDSVVNSVPHQRVALIAHSLGGAVAARYLERYPDDFDAAVLSSPMLQINTDPFPEAAALFIASLAVAAGSGKEYAIGQGPRPEPCFDNNTVTHSRPRWSVWEESLLPAYPEIACGGASYRWVQASLCASRAARLQAYAVRIPVLLFQAGEDVIVKPEGQDLFCAAAQDCTAVYFDGARHEILMEKDSIRDRALAEIMAFLAE